MCEFIGSDVCISLKHRQSFMPTDHAYFNRVQSLLKQTGDCLIYRASRTYIVSSNGVTQVVAAGKQLTAT